MNSEQETIYYTKIHALEDELARCNTQIEVLVADVKRQAVEIRRLRVAAGEVPEPEGRF